MWNWIWNIFMDAICREKANRRSSGQERDARPFTGDQLRAPRRAPGPGTHRGWGSALPNKWLLGPVGRPQGHSRAGSGCSPLCPCHTGGDTELSLRLENQARPRARGRPAPAHLSLQPSSQGGPRVIDDDKHVALDRYAQGNDRFAVLDFKIPGEQNQEKQ